MHTARRGQGKVGGDGVGETGRVARAAALGEWERMGNSVRRIRTRRVGEREREPSAPSGSGRAAPAERGPLSLG